MKLKFLPLYLFLATFVHAGILKVATYPVRHPVKSEKAVFKAVKAVVW